MVIPNSQPSLERRRVIGPLRERTIFIQTNFSNQKQQKDIDFTNYSSQTVENRTYAPNYNSQKREHDTRSENQDVNDCIFRITDHLSAILLSQQRSLNVKLENIEDHAKKAQQLQGTIEERLKNLKKILKEKKSIARAQTPQIRSAYNLCGENMQKHAQTPGLFSQGRYEF